MRELWSQCYGTRGNPEAVRSGAAPRARAAARAPRPRHRHRPPHLPAVSRLSGMPPPLPAPPAPVRAFRPRERMPTRSGARPRTAPAAVAPPGPSCYGTETMWAPSSGQSRAFRAPRAEEGTPSAPARPPSGQGPAPPPTAAGRRAPSSGQSRAFRAPHGPRKVRRPPQPVPLRVRGRPRRQRLWDDARPDPGAATARALETQRP